jgi:hypothetical protein
MGNAVFSVSRDGQTDVEAPKVPFDSAKQYQYTWPGQAPCVVSGAELSKLCAGADPSMLNIVEVAPAAAAVEKTSKQMDAAAKAAMHQKEDSEKKSAQS